MTNAPDLYRVAGHNLERFIAEWLDDVALDPKEQSAIVEALSAGASPDLGDRARDEYSFHETLLVSLISTRAAVPTSNPEEVLLAAVLWVFQRERDAARAALWISDEEHVIRALLFARDAGDASMARKLMLAITAASVENQTGHAGTARARVAASDPAQAAAWDGALSLHDQAAVRAAKLFDPTLNFDAQVFCAED